MLYYNLSKNCTKVIIWEFLQWCLNVGLKKKKERKEQNYTWTETKELAKTKLTHEQKIVPSGRYSCCCGCLLTERLSSIQWKHCANTCIWSQERHKFARCMPRGRWSAADGLCNWRTVQSRQWSFEVRVQPLWLTLCGRECPDQELRTGLTIFFSGHTL